MNFVASHVKPFSSGPGYTETQPKFQIVHDEDSGTRKLVDVKKASSNAKI